MDLLLLQIQNGCWILEQLCSWLMIQPNSWLHPFSGVQNIAINNGHLLPISHKWQGILSTPTRTLSLKSLLLVPSILHNMILVNKLASNNQFSITFYSNGFIIKVLKTNSLLLRGPISKGIHASNPHFFITKPSPPLA